MNLPVLSVSKKQDRNAFHRTGLLGHGHRERTGTDGLQEIQYTICGCKRAKPASGRLLPPFGLRTFERTETDGQGNPFPILKMERERFSLRHATPEDIPVLKTLFTDTVLRTNRKDYTQEEVEDWAACADKPGHWKELIVTHHL